MTDTEAAAEHEVTRTRRPRGDVLGIVFVLAAVAVAAWALRDELPAIGASLRTIGWWRVLVASALAVVGLLATAEVWRQCLAALGAHVSPKAGRQIFFPAQAGKYLPGSVWPFLAQARFAHRYGVRPASALLAGTVFLVVHLVTSVPASALLLIGQPTLLEKFGWLGLGALAGLVLLHPRVLTAGVQKLAKRSEVAPPVLGWAQVGKPLAWMVPAWLSYGLGGYLLAAPLGASGPLLLVLCTGAFALGWLVGLLVVIAPAGVGAREAVLILVFTPALGVAGATTVALLLRVVHTVADVGLGLAYGMKRS